MGARRALAAALALLLAAGPAAAQSGGGDRGAPAPVIAWAMLDDYGWDQRPGGVSTLQTATPALDALEADGATLTALYATPSCAPSRVAAVYGLRQPISLETSGPISAGFDYTRPSLGELVERAGGVAVAIGKAGPRAGSPPTSTTFGYWAPVAMGWSRYQGLVNTHPPSGFRAWDRVTLTRAAFDAVPGGDFIGNPPTIDARSTYIDEELAGAAAAELAAAPRARPFVLWFGTYDVHARTQSAPHVWPDPAAPAPTATCGLGDEACREAKAAAMDARIAELRAALPPGAYLLVTADNGSEAGSGAAGKGDVAENGIRVPGWIVGPGIAPGSTVDELVDLTDLRATVLDLAGASLSTDTEASGYSITEPLGLPCRVPGRCWGDAAAHDVVAIRGLVDWWALRSSVAPAHKVVTHTGTGASSLFDLTTWAGGAAESGDLCGGDGDCSNLAGADRAAYVAICARFASTPGIGAGCPAI